MEIGNLNEPFQHRSETKKVDKVSSTVWIRISDESKPVPRHTRLYQNQELDGCWGYLVQDCRLLMFFVGFDIPLISPVRLNVHLSKSCPIMEITSGCIVSSLHAEYFFSGWSA